MSSHRFLLRRVWHLAIPTPPAMGYSPTEYAEFTEPPAEMSSHGFHRFTQILRVRCSPTEFTEFTEFGSVGMAGMPYPPTSVPSVGVLSQQEVLCVPCVLWEYLFSHGFYRFTQILMVRCSPTEFTEFGSVGMAGMPYPPTSVNIRAHLWETLLCQKFPCVPCSSVGGSSLPEVSVRSVRSVGISFLPQNSQNSQNLSAWVWQGCHTLLICEHPCHLWEALLCKRFCVFGAFRGSFFTACSVGAAETAAPPGGIHRSSVQISPPHHLTTSPSISPRTQPSACPPSTVGTTSSPLAAR